MKASKQDAWPPPRPEFVPFDLILRVETREEAQALFAIFNYGPNRDLLPRLNRDTIKHLLNDYYVTAGVIANKITYGVYY